MPGREPSSGRRSLNGGDAAFGVVVFEEDAQVGPRAQPGEQLVVGRGVKGPPAEVRHRPETHGPVRRARRDPAALRRNARLAIGPV